MDIKFSSLGAMLFFISACSYNQVKNETTYNKTDSPHETESYGRTPATLNKTGNSSYEMVTCGLTVNEKFKILKNGADMNRGGRTDASGCINTTFRDGIVKPGDILVIEVNGKNQASETVPGSKGNSSGNGNNSNQSNRNDDKPVAPPKSLPSEDLSSVRSAAENNARCMANAVVAAYGKMERYRYNFQRGLREGIYLYNWSNLGSLRTTPEYIRGTQEGESRGSSDGLVAGRESGASRGQSEGESSAYRNFSASVDTGTPPNIDSTPPATSYEGAKTTISYPRSVEERIEASNSEVQSWLRSIDFSYDDWRWDPWSDYWNPSKLYSWNNYDFDLVRSWYRDEWAWNLWRQKSFSRCRNQVSYYDRISDPLQTKNSTDAERTFRTKFKDEYDSVIGSKWIKEVKAEEPVAFTFGRSLGFKIGQDFAKELGYYNGYSTSYSTASIQGYKETYASGYRNGFDAAKKKYETGIFLSDLSAEIKSSNGRGFGVGSDVNVVIKAVKNIGRQPGEPKVIVSGNVNNPNPKSFKIGYSESLKQPVTLAGLGTVAAGTAPDKQGQLSIRVENLQQSFNMNVSWEETIQNLAQSSAGTTSAIIDYMKVYLAKEWKDVASGLGGNKYDNSVSDTLLEKLADIYRQGSPELKTKIKGKVSDLKSVLGSQPGRLSWDDRKKWNSASKIYDSMK